MIASGARAVLLVVGMALAALLPAAGACADSVEIIELKHRPAEELIPVLKPMVDADGALSGQGYRLFIRSSAGNVEQIRQLVGQLDHAPRQLLISVFQGSERELRSARLSLSAEYQTEPPGFEASARGLSTRARLQDNPVHRLRISEGAAGYIETGRSIPYFSGRVWRAPTRDLIGTGIEYKDIHTGFYVLPRLHDDQVTLDISPYKETLSRAGGDMIDSRSVATRVSGPLGRWIEIGAVQTDSRAGRDDATSSTSTRRRNDEHIWIRADPVQ